VPNSNNSNSNGGNRFADILANRVNQTDSGASTAITQDITGETPMIGAKFVPIGSIAESSFQIRTVYDADAMQELSADIAERGILEPLIVRPLIPKQVGEIQIGSNEIYELVAGSRRLRAAKNAGSEVVPVIIRDFDNYQAKLAMLIENLQRVDLTPNEEMIAFRALQAEYNLSLQQIADIIHRSPAYVSLTLHGKRHQQLVANGEINNNPLYRKDTGNSFLPSVSQTEDIPLAPSQYDNEQTRRQTQNLNQVTDAEYRYVEDKPVFRPLQQTPLLETQETYTPSALHQQQAIQAAPTPRRFQIAAVQDTFDWLDSALHFADTIRQNEEMKEQVRRNIERVRAMLAELEEALEG